MDSHCQERCWQDVEIDLASNIATQIAIAIQQSISRSQLREEISARIEAETALKQFNKQLELTIKERTAALQDSETRFRRFFDFAPIGIAVADLQTYQFVAVNHNFCQLLGYTEHELLELGTCLTVSDVADWELERPYAESMMRGEVNSYQIKFKSFAISKFKLKTLNHKQTITTIRKAIVAKNINDLVN
jgi:PAS domain S-box-containing protein